MLPTTAVVCQWRKPEFVVGCESVNIGHDQPWELFPAGAGMLSAQKLDDFLVLCQLMLALDLAKYPIWRVHLGSVYVSPKTVTL